MKHSSESIAYIKNLLATVTADEFAILEQHLLADERKGVANALDKTRSRLAAEERENLRVQKLYAYQNELSSGRLAMGLDEVGRGPLAGPLTVAAVVLPDQPQIAGLNDSKQVPEKNRENLALEIKQNALAWHIEHIEPAEIDSVGMGACLKIAFMRAIKAIDSQIEVACVLLDGNPLCIDSREINVIKGDSKCASIAAASLIAKATRDSLMSEYAKEYPHYHFESCKGYASPLHIEAIKTEGLCPLHRKTFCTSFMQESLF